MQACLVVNNLHKNAVYIILHYITLIWILNLGLGMRFSRRVNGPDMHDSGSCITFTCNPTRTRTKTKTKKKTLVLTNLYDCAAWKKQKGGACMFSFSNFRRHTDIDATVHQRWFGFHSLKFIKAWARQAPTAISLCSFEKATHRHTALTRAILTNCTSITIHTA